MSGLTGSVTSEVVDHQPPALLGDSTAPVLACPACEATFSTRHKLATHASRVHQIYSRARFFVDATNVCWACHRCFHTRKRAIYHIGQCSENCLDFLQATYHPLDWLRVQELDALTRRGGAQAGQKHCDEARRLVVPVEEGVRSRTVAFCPPCLVLRRPAGCSLPSFCYSSAQA